MARRNHAIDLNAVKRAIESLKRDLNRLSGGEIVPKRKLADLQKDIGLIESLFEGHEVLMKKTSDLADASGEIKTEYGELRKKFVELLAAYRALKQPPHAYVNFVRHLGAADIVVDDSGKTKKFPLLEVTDSGGIYRRMFLVNKDVKPADLKRGERLIVSSPDPSSGGNVIGRTEEFDLLGEEAEVEQVLGEDREGISVLIKSSDRGVAKLAHVSKGFSGDLKPGKRIMVGHGSGLVMGVLPDKESQKYLIPQIPKETFGDMGAVDSSIKQIEEDIMGPILYPHLYARFGKPMFRGYVWHGPPGCGKSMLAKALTNELARLLGKKHGIDVKGNFFYVGGTELLVKWVGDTEGLLRDIFAAAKNASQKTNPPSPSVIAFDDAEVMFKTRGSAISSDVNESHVTQICTLLQGMEDRGNVIVLFLTNRPEMMDPAVTRHGRVSDSIYIPRPDRAGAKDIFSKYLKADWNVLHPKYNVDIYIPKKDGKPTADDAGSVKKIRFANDPRNVADYLIEGALERMFGKPNDFKNELLRVRYAGDKDFTVLRYGDFISGAIIAEGIMPKVLQMAINEAKEQEDSGKEISSGIQLKFVYGAIESVFEKMRQTITTRSSYDLVEWLTVQGHKSRTIERIEPAGNSIGAKGGSFFENEEKEEEL